MSGVPTATVRYHTDHYRAECPRCQREDVFWAAIPDLTRCHYCQQVYEPVDEAQRDEPFYGAHLDDVPVRDTHLATSCRSCAAYGHYAPDRHR